MPLSHKEVHLVNLANTLAQNSMMIFTRTVHDAQKYVQLMCPSSPHELTSYLVLRLSIILRTLGFPAVPLHGQLSQSQRLGALSKFKSGGRSILVATDVASRYVLALASAQM